MRISSATHDPRLLGIDLLAFVVGVAIVFTAIGWALRPLQQPNHQRPNPSPNDAIQSAVPTDARSDPLPSVAAAFDKPLWYQPPPASPPPPPPAEAPPPTPPPLSLVAIERVSPQDDQQPAAFIAVTFDAQANAIRRLISNDTAYGWLVVAVDAHQLTLRRLDGGGDSVVLKLREHDDLPR